MGKYSLIAINKKYNIRHTINVYDLEKKEYKEKVHIKDIDAFTSQFKSSIDFIKYLKEKEIIDFEDASFYIVSKYKDDNLYFRTIFNSSMIHDMAQTVDSGYIDASKDGYTEILNSFYSRIQEDKFAQSIENAVTITPSVKTLMLQYMEGTKREKYSEDEIRQEALLRMKINSELKRYKTFRGIHLFIEEYKKYGFVAKPKERYEEKTNNEPSKQAESEQTIFTRPNFDYEPEERIDNVQDYNERFDENITPEEYSQMFGEGNATQYTIQKRS